MANGFASASACCVSGRIGWSSESSSVQRCVLLPGSGIGACRKVSAPGGRYPAIVKTVIRVGAIRGTSAGLDSPPGKLELSIVKVRDATGEPRSFGSAANDVVESIPGYIGDLGPIRWICAPENPETVPNAPLLLYLSGLVEMRLESTSLSEELSRLFRLKFLRIPTEDRTCFQGLVSFVEEKVRDEAVEFPDRPLYLVGDSFGACLAVAVAARNPGLDLVLILINPATAVEKLPVQLVLPLLQLLPTQLFVPVSVLLSSLKSNPLQVVSSTHGGVFPISQTAQEFAENVFDLLSTFQKGTAALAKDILLWKLELLASSSADVNSQLLRIKSDVLILISEEGQFLSDINEIRRLSKNLPNCTYRITGKEETLCLASWIKSTGLYRQTTVKDLVQNFIPPSEKEKYDFLESTKVLRRLLSPVFFSTLADGQIIQGLSIPSIKNPIIFVGYHYLLGIDLGLIFGELLKTCERIPRGLGHPIMFNKSLLEEHPAVLQGDKIRLYGAVPASPKNLFKLLSQGDNVLLYPGGSREALHRRGEEHKLFWPEHAEFVRMAARFGATIIPFSTIGGDEIAEIIMDYKDFTSLPLLGDMYASFFKQLPTFRTDFKGEVGDQILHVPLLLPKLPGRVYYLFGKPIHTEGKQEFFLDRKNSDACYNEVKATVESGIQYLLEMRQQDPYRDFIPRFLYESTSNGRKQAPTFVT